MFKERSTIDLVVIILSITIGGVLLLSVFGALLMKLIHPVTDISRAVEAITNITTTIVGALVGFIGGRAAGRWEGANGNAEGASNE